MLDVPYHRQNREYTCGPACLRMALAYYGHEADEVTLTMLCNTTVLGTRVRDLIGAAQQLGFEGEYAFGQDFAAITEAMSRDTPVIVTVDAGMLHQRPDWAGYKHMVVVVGADQNSVTYHDPQIGPSLVSATTVFLEAWTAKEKEIVLIWPLI